MQLSSPSAPAPPADLAAGLEACAAQRGQRPAVTHLSAAGRSEQGFVTLAQWAAKGAHLLQVDLDLVPGDRVLVDIPPGWTLAAVCAAVWWVGGVVVVPGSEEVGALAGAVVHVDRARPAAPEVYVVGDAVDGGVEGGAGGDLVWAEEVQAFPDQPPTRSASGRGVALFEAGVEQTHGELVAMLAAHSGVLGVDRAGFTGSGVVEVAARPLVTGRATVVLDGVDRAVAAGDRVSTWA